MRETARTTQQQIPVPATLDVQAVEHKLNEIWKEQNAGAQDREEEGALIRARVMNLMVYVTSRDALDEINEVLAEVASTHPCRALVMCAESEGEEHDIEMFVSAFCHEAEGTDARQLCCEQVSMIASGRFAPELPSAAAPLLVSDLPTYLYWHDRARFGEDTFQRLCREADRIILDSAMFSDAHDDVKALGAFIEELSEERATVSDLNWARLTAWRALLAGFFDAPQSLGYLERINGVTVEYVAPEGSGEGVAPQALMISGWLASRLGWSAKPERMGGAGDSSRMFSFEKDGREITVELKRVERPEMRQGRLARVRLDAESNEPTSFEVLRSEDGVYLETCARVGEESHGERVFKVRNRSAGNLLGRELEILSHDRIYEEAIRAAVRMIREK